MTNTDREIRFHIPGYEISQRLYQGTRSSIYRGWQTQDHRSIIIKIPTRRPPTDSDISRIRRDFEIGSTFHDPRIIRYHALIPFSHGLALIEEDCDVVSLAEMIPKEGFPLSQFLEIAIQMAEGLSVIHWHDIIHKDVTSYNVLINSDTQAIKFIDFGIASQLRQETHSARSLNRIEGILAYVSPEQTGRMNRTLDYRTDFYSLGITFYELLCGHLPFTQRDPMELVHSHLARVPVPPHELKAEIPEAVSGIIMKLLAKNAEERYQSGSGLKVDLERCLHELKTKGKVTHFTLGQQDFSEKFRIPQTLYGRDREIEELVATFERASRGPLEVLLVSGYAGVGKSVLVNEIQKLVIRRQSYFIVGKFEQFSRGLAYSAIAQAFQSLVRQLLGESEQQIQTWKDRLLSALGPNGQIVIAVIPEVELIIGPQPTVPEVGSVESKNRFNLVFQKFVRALAQPEHPLVLFLDDLQWADSASLNLIRLLATDPEIRYFLLIGAFRGNEADTSHPTRTIMETIRKAGGKVHDIALLPLDMMTVRRWVADTLGCQPDQSQPLADLIYQKTEGNPFFIRTFFQSLYDEKFLTFTADSGWQWNIEEIRRLHVTDNVAELMARRTNILPEASQRLLKTAACLGSTFSLERLMIVTDKSQDEMLSDLHPAINTGMVIQADGHFLFAHDQVQEAAYTLIPDTQKAHAHLAIGRILLSKTPNTDRDKILFDTVDHLNLGRELISDAAERMELVRLNLQAGKKAKTSAAYEPAFKYFQAGINLLETESWQRQYELTLGLYVEAAEAAYLSGNFEQMEQLVSVVLQRATSLLDKVKAYEIKIEARIARYTPSEAIDTALQAVKLLGTRFPENPKRLHILLGLLRTKFALMGRQIEELGNLPEMTDPNKLAAMRILSSVGSAAYNASPALMPLIAFKGVNLSVKYGNTSVSAYAYASYGVVLCAIGDIEFGYQCGQLALRVLGRFDAKELKARTFMVVNDFIRHWKEHVRDGLEPLQEAYQSGLETGDIEFAAYSVYIYSYHSYFIGKELEALEREMAAYTDTIVQLKQETALHFLKIYRQVVLNVLGRADSSAGSPPCRLIGESYDEQVMLPLALKANHKSAIYHVYFNKLFLCYLFQKYPQAVEYANMAETYLEGVRATLTVALFHFYDSLARLAVFSKLQKSKQKHILRKVASNQKKMKKWAYHAPMNHLHKFYLVEAEWARVLRKDIMAMDYYDKAIELAREHEYINEEALAHELAARFWLSKGKETFAKIYMTQAHDCYQCWGAKRKVKALEDQYPDLIGLVSIQDQPTISQIGGSFTEVRETSDSDSAVAFDMITVTKASQAISKEIHLERVLSEMMAIIIENAGAQKGVLVLQKEGQLCIEAAATMESAKISVLQSIPVAESGDLSPAIVRYVIRTGENVVLHDAAQEGQFTQDQYVVQHQPKSVLCAPLRHKDEVSGVLYLENDLVTHAFTEERLTLIQLLLTQAAISLENARLYEAMKVEVTERKQAEKALQASEQRYRLLADNSTDMISKHTPEGNYSYVSPACHHLLGYEPSELVGRSAYDFFHPEDLSAIRTSHSTILEQPVIYTVAYRIRHKDGHYIWVETNSRTIRNPESGHVQEIIAITRDITDRKQMEFALKEERVSLAQKVEERTAELRKANAELAQASRLKDEFLANMSHELRTPLNVVLGMAESLQEEVYGPLNDRQLKSLRMIQESGRHLLTLIIDILDLSKIGAGKLELDLIPVSVESICQASLRLVNQIAQKKRLKISCMFDNDVMTIQADGRRLKQILINLLNNAVKFTPEGGKIGLEVKGDPRQHAVHVTVWDTGIGIAQDDMERLFQPFVQLDAGLSRRYEGTGLGLSLVYHLVEMHGGSISVESEVGQGSRFTISLPWRELGDEEIGSLEDRERESLRDRESKDGASHPPIFPSSHLLTSPSHPSAMILIADDNENTIQTLAAYLTARGYRLMIARDGKEAIERTNEGHPDLIVMDIHMPTMSGIEAIQCLREDENMKSIPIIALTALAMPGDREKCLDAGANMYFSKPVSLRRLSEAIENLLAREE